MVIGAVCKEQGSYVCSDEQVTITPEKTTQSTIFGGREKKKCTAEDKSAAYLQLHFSNVGSLIADLHKQAMDLQTIATSLNTFKTHIQYAHHALTLKTT